MKLRDVLLKPIGKITAKDGIDIIRPNGEVKDAESECCIYIGDRVKNSSDKAIALIINEREITLEPGQVTTVIPITNGVIEKIAKLQDEILNGKSIEELEETAAGKELIKELSSLGEAIFEHGGHYSNIHASTNPIDFIKNIKQLEAAPSREPNIYEDTNPISAPVSTPKIEAPINNIHGAEPKVEPKPEPKPAPITPFTKDHIVFIEDANGNGTLTVDENGNPFLFTTVRVKFPGNIKAFDIINISKEDGSWTDGKVVTNIADGYVEFDMPIQNDFGKRVKLVAEHLNQNGDHIATVTNGLNIDKLPPLDDITFPEDANGDGTLGLTENATNPNSTTVRVGIPSYSGSGDIITIKDKDGTTTLGTATLTPADKTKGYVEINVPVTKGKTLEIAVDLEHSTIKTKPTQKSLVIESDPMPKLKATDITFTEDANSDGKLTPAENTTTPTTTTVKITLPDDVKVGDKIKIADKNGTYSDSHVITTSDKTNGHISFEAPATKGKTIDAEVKVERDGEDGGAAHKELKVFQPMGMVGLVATEDADGDLELTDFETADPSHTTVRVTLDSNVIVGDKVNVEGLKAGSTETKVHTVVADDITRGYIDFEGELKFNNSGSGAFHAKGWLERGSETSGDSFLDLSLKSLTPQLHVRVFLEDTSRDNKLSVLENTTTPDTTTLAIAIDTNTVKVGDIIKVKDANNTSYTGTHTVTAADLAPSAGYITFEMPAIKGTTIKPKISVTRGSKTWGPENYLMDDLEIENDPRDQVSLSIDPINTTGHITDADLSHRTIKAVIRVNHAELLNDGYEIEVKAYDKTIKAYKQDDGTYAADIRLADYKDDADQKITATLKNATVNIDNGVSPVSTPVPEKTAEASYDTHFTRSVLDILDVNGSNVMTLADIKNDTDVHINGEVRGIYNKVGDKVFITLPSGTVVPADVNADGTFSAVIKPSALGYPTTTDPDTYYRKYFNNNINAKYTNDTGTYTDSDNFYINLKSGFFGLKPTFELAEDNNADIHFVDMNKKMGASQFKNSINLDETDKIYSTPNGGKFKINLDFSNYNWQTPQNNHLVLNEEGIKALNSLTAGWKYEVYLTKSRMSDFEYSYASFESLRSDRTHIKLYEGTIIDGKTRYTHDFNIKDYEPTRPTDNMIYDISVKLIPPVGDHTYSNFIQDGNVYVLNSDLLQKDNHLMDTDPNRKYYQFESIINTFSNAPLALLGKKIGNFAFTKDSDANTLYYTPSVDKIDMTSFLFGAKDHIAANNSDFNSTLVAWLKNYEKPDEVYLTINGKKYEGIIDPKVAKVRFKDIDTLDFKNDPDHKYEITVVNRDKYENKIRTTKEIAYNVIDEPAVSTAEIDKSFSIYTNGIAIETNQDETKGLIVRSGVRDQDYIGNKNTTETFMAFESNFKGEIIFTLRNKYVSHLDHDITLKLDIQTNGNNVGKLWWYDPSDDKIKEVHNNEITIKAGTAFKDIRIAQMITDNDTLNYDVIDNTTNEYGGIVANSNMSLKKQNVVIKLKNSNDEVLSTINTFVGDNDYDVLIDPNGSSVNMLDYLQYNSMDGHRKLTFNNTVTSTYSISETKRILDVPIEFANENVNVTFLASGNHYNRNHSFKELIFSKGNNVLNLSGMYGVANIDAISSNMSAAELASNPTYTLEIRRPDDLAVNFLIKGDREHDFQGLNILKSTGNKPLTFNLESHRSDDLVAMDHKTIKNLTTSENVNFMVSNDLNVVVDNFNISNNGVAAKPTLTFKPEASGYSLDNQVTTIKNSTINANIIDAPSLVIDNTRIGVPGDSTPTTITLSGNLELKSSAVFLNSVEITAMDGKKAANNHYFIDMIIDKDFTLTDTTIKNGGTNKFTFGEHSNVGNHANFNVDNSELIFESGSEFHGKVKAGSGNNSITIKSGATFDGTIDMGDSISNIVIEQGAHLGPNFHIGETGTENEQTSGKYDTLTIFDDLDFNNVDVRGIEQINIGTKARGEMINLDLAYSELANLMRGNNNTIKFWGDNDNNLTLHNESGKTFAMAADQSGVNGQPYTRYEVTDTIAGTTLRFDVHNDINLQIQ